MWMPILKDGYLPIYKFCLNIDRSLMDAFCTSEMPQAKWGKWRLSPENSGYKEIWKNANVTKEENAWRSHSRDRSRLVESKTWKKATRLHSHVLAPWLQDHAQEEGNEVAFQAIVSERQEESLSYITIFLFPLMYLFSPPSCCLLLSQTEMPMVIWHY